MEIGKQIKEHRKRMEWTQKGLAAKLNVSDKTISSWETGRTYPELSLLVELSELFNTSLDELLKGDRFNPFMEMKIGYATLPTSVTYNDGKKYKEDGRKNSILIHIRIFG